MIDLDHNATTPVDPRVRTSMVALWEREDLGNPASQHRRGQAARQVVENARRTVAAALGAEPLGVTFTSGGTEAANLAILGAGRALRAAGRPNGVLVSPLEHPAVGAAVAQLRAEGHVVVTLEVDAMGRIGPAQVAEALEREPQLGLVSVAAANHELGNRYDIGAIVAAARAVRSDVIVHTDAVQAVGKVPVSWREWGVDLLSLSAHKFGGPTGIGALVHDRRAKIEPVLRGGGQERGRRAGTESTWLTHGLGRAIELATAEQADRLAATTACRERLLAGLIERGARIHGDPDHHTGNTINAAFAGCDGELVMMNLDLAGIAVSTGAACSSGSPEPSPVVLALGLPAADAREAVRFSLGMHTTEAEIDATLAALDEIVSRVRAAADDSGPRVRAAGEHTQ